MSERHTSSGIDNGDVGVKQHLNYMFDYNFNDF